MSDTTPTNSSARPEDEPTTTVPDTAAQGSAQPNTSATTQTYPATPSGWGAAPAPTSTATLDAPATNPAGQYGQQSGQPYGQDPYAAPPAAYGAAFRTDAGTWNAGQQSSTPWYGGTSGRRKGGKPKPPWFWPVIAVAIGLAALLAGGGIGFAIGHAIGAHQSQSTTQVPGNGFPGGSGGTNQFPGYGTQGGTDSGSGTGTDGSSSSGTSSSDTSNS